MFLLLQTARVFIRGKRKIKGHIVEPRWSQQQPSLMSFQIMPYCSGFTLTIIDWGLEFTRTHAHTPSTLTHSVLTLG